ncbi:hypothetical protein [Bradyrhizobium sp. Tv2a-2]|uniref:hypothetical protein n=1 Tax=Bradyrhizobium sp. Tv2a-2 TaxID=113395 RepID=UPI000402D9DC|nr:hypothetical protein [Bradyrhizobium sp. Tv2a-2]
MHEIIVGLGLPTVSTPEGEPHKFVLYSTLSSGRGTAARFRTPLLIDAAVRAGTSLSSGQAIALEAVNNQIVRFEALRQTLIVGQ